MYKIDAKIQKTEHTETRGVVLIYFTSTNGDLKLELPEKINYFKDKDDVSIRFVNDGQHETDDKLFTTGYVYSNVINDQDTRIIHISIGGLNFKLELTDKAEIPILKNGTQLYIGFK